MCSSSRSCLTSTRSNARLPIKYLSFQHQHKSLMRTIKNSVDCPKLQLSCPKFDIPCDTEDVSVYIKVGSGERVRYIWGDCCGAGLLDYLLLLQILSWQPSSGDGGAALGVPHWESGSPRRGHWLQYLLRCKLSPARAISFSYLFIIEGCFCYIISKNKLKKFLVTGGVIKMFYHLLPHLLVLFYKIRRICPSWNNFFGRIIVFASV